MRPDLQIVCVNNPRWKVDNEDTHHFHLDLQSVIGTCMYTMLVKQVSFLTVFFLLLCAIVLLIGKTLFGGRGK